jgi:hypothetical protein
MITRRSLSAKHDVDVLVEGLLSVEEAKEIALKSCTNFTSSDDSSSVDILLFKGGNVLVVEGMNCHHRVIEAIKREREVAQSGGAGIMTD